MELKVKDKVVAGLEKIVGADFVSTALPDLYSYSEDMTENEPHWPDFVVMPGSVEEVQGVLRLANREKIPVVPVIAAANIGGLTIPLKGGISLDLGRMDRILELNVEDMYIVVEPAVTFGHLQRHLEKNCPHLTYSFPAAPPSTSIMGNALTMGMGGMMTKIGGNWDNVSSMEVVLPTGEVVKIGSCAVTPYWFGLAPLPDIAGLFIGWQGGTGVVTKMAVSLWPKPKFAESKALLTYTISDTFRFMRRIGASGIVDGVAALPAEGVKWYILRDMSPIERLPSEPMFMVSMMISGYSEDEVKAKAASRDEIIAEEFEGKQFVPMPPTAVPPEMRDLVRGSIEHMGGTTWLGSFGPCSQWEAATEKVFELFDKYKLPRHGAFTPIRGGHFGMWRIIIGFNKDDADEVARVRGFMRECGELALDMGFIPYKASYWNVDNMLKRGDPNWVKLMERVKKMLDPNNIMNPGRYGSPRE